MAFHTEDDASHIEEAIETLDKCVSTGERLCTWAMTKLRSNEPLSALLGEQIQTLSTETHRLRNAIRNLDIIVHPQHASEVRRSILPVEIDLALLHTKALILETLELVELHDEEEKSGPDGALNALFASIYILNRYESYDEGFNFPRNDRLLEHGLEVRKIIAELTATAPYSNLVSPAGALSIFEQLEPRITASVSMIAKQLRPRYIHTYEAFAQCPYMCDAAGTVYCGSFGTVQKVCRKRSGEALAMKTFRNIFSDETGRKILREVGVLEVCFHKNIVRLVEAFKVDEDEHCIRLVMSPWAPYTLTTFLHASEATRKKRCTWFAVGSVESDRTILRIMYELADAVDYLHERSIKHKDLKPDNILLYRETSIDVMPVITDVGVSKIYIPGAATNHTDSTYEYLAPEQHQLVASTPSADVWQLGCCFAELQAVALGGSSAYEKLHNSFNNDRSSCSIALEHAHFMKTLVDLCKKSNAIQRITCGIIAGMLELDPQKRLNIRSVKAAMAT